MRFLYNFTFMISTTHSSFAQDEPPILVMSCGRFWEISCSARNVSTTNAMARQENKNLILLHNFNNYLTYHLHSSSQLGSFPVTSTFQGEVLQTLHTYLWQLVGDV